MAVNMTSAGHFIGVDIGGTGVKGGIVNLEKGEILGNCVRLATPQPADPESVADVVRQLVDELTAGSEAGLDSTVGVTFPGIVQHGTSRSAANMDRTFVDFDIATHFSERIRRPVAVLNDADAAGLAEARYGAGRGTRGTVLVITLGTGIGSALIFDGDVLPNVELGHISIDGHDAETRASAVARERDGLGWKEYSVRLQRYLSELEFMFSPELIIVGGGISQRTDEYLPLLTLRTPVVPAKLRNDAGIVGASIQAASTAPTYRAVGAPFQ
ncbi:polyphosphate--glucose phosphotransferase [Arthrobacter sp. efr-133-TYG-120]|uniref:polyphosphate--glucose phosphotransferase n=2 Tax=unclassified Arthrobacter TaxID=235627 RepID=UPI00254D7448|nr:ROK family protein [Arthrobacter sp. efr-133-TYG-120]